MGLRPHSIYGSSEMQALYALAPQATGEQVAVAPVSADADVRAVDGELLLRGPSGFNHYLGDADRTQRARDAEGFFHSGDHGDVADGRRSEEHTSELQSLMRISYAVFCLKKKKQKNSITLQYNKVYNVREHKIIL